MARVLVLLLAAASAIPSAQSQSAAPRRAEGRVVRPSAFLHVVADMERSVAFYRDVAGFTVNLPPEPLIASTLLQQASNATPRASARSASFTIPGFAMEFILIEFTGAPGRASVPRLYDPGMTWLSVEVADLDKAFATAKASGLIGTAPGAGPVSTVRRDLRRAVTFRDPDGFMLELVQSESAAAAKGDAQAAVSSTGLSLVVEDTDRALAFWRDILGFTVEPTNSLAETVQVRSTPMTPPGTTNVWYLWEFTQVGRVRRAPRVSDPGAAALSILVEDLDALLQRVRAGGVRIETASGAPVTLGSGLRGALVRSPDGLLVELIEPAGNN
jgi:methylmalonyl-CoA/ethylmalonyl-CoA epimerase